MVLLLWGWCDTMCKPRRGTEKKKKKKRRHHTYSGDGGLTRGSHHRCAVPPLLRQLWHTLSSPLPSFCFSFSSAPPHPSLHSYNEPHPIPIRPTFTPCQAVDSSLRISSSFTLPPPPPPVRLSGWTTYYYLAFKLHINLQSHQHIPP